MTGKPIPEPEFLGRALMDMRPAMDVTQYDVAEWCSTQDGSGPPEHVHLRFTLADLPADFVIRFKSAAELDRLIALLSQYRQRVWPQHDERA